MEDGGLRIEDRGSKMEDRRWRVEGRVMARRAILDPRSSILDLQSLKCPICRGDLISAQSPEVTLGWPSCAETFPVVNGIPRMISSAMRQARGGDRPADLTQIDRLRVETARSFGFALSRNAAAPTESYTLSLYDAPPTSGRTARAE